MSRVIICHATVDTDHILQHYARLSPDPQITYAPNTAQDAAWLLDGVPHDAAGCQFHANVGDEVRFKVNASTANPLRRAQICSVFKSAVPGNELVLESFPPFATHGEPPAYDEIMVRVIGRGTQHFWITTVLWHDGVKRGYFGLGGTVIAA